VNERSQGRRNSRPRVLVSARACGPNLGSEPGVGWNFVRELAGLCEVEVLTRRCFKAAIESELLRRPMSGIRFHYFEATGRPEKLGRYLDNYLWQLRALFVGRRLHADRPFDLIHHVTLASYSIPAFLHRLGCPFVFGPVGGGESVPPAFQGWFSLRGRAYEALRSANHRLNALNPLIRATVQASAWAGGTTRETAAKLTRIGAPNVEVLPAVGLLREDVDALAELGTAGSAGVRFVSVGRLLHWKGFDLGIRAFAEAGLPVAEYWLVGDGPERRRLEALADSLGISSKVRFTGSLPHQQTIDIIAKSCALIHPSLHDSGGFVCLEAMAARRPAICIDVGGPGLLVGADCGYKVAPTASEQTISALSAAITDLARDRELRCAMGEAGHARVLAHFTFDVKVRHFLDVYDYVLDNGPGPPDFALTS
jgi:glycosyltransferase involved in cell wall biosynthesis